MTAHKQSLTDLLTECARACNHCAVMCMKENHSEALDSCIRFTLDCAQICRVTESSISSGSEHVMHLLKECWEICSLCAEECRKHENEHCILCAEVCIRCAEACGSFYVSSTV